MTKGSCASTAGREVWVEAVRRVTEGSWASTAGREVWVRSGEKGDRGLMGFNGGKGSMGKTLIEG